MRLYNYWRSSASWRVRIALELKGLSYEYVPVHLVRGGGEQHQADHRARNPMRQVPVLEVEEGGKVQLLTQSLAILEYLEERYPEPPLLPADPIGRARVRALAEVMNSGIQPLHNLSVIQYVKEQGGDEKAFAAHWVRRGLEALEAMVQPWAGRFCHGDAPTFADVCLVPQLYAARRFGVEVDRYPTLQRIEAACAELPAFRRAHAEAQPDAQVAAG